MNKHFRQEVLNRIEKAGLWLNLGSVDSVVISARLGYDWVLLDYEHGAGDESNMRQQLALLAQQKRTKAIVRIPNLNDCYFKQALDWGAHGVMVPRIKSADEARTAVNYLRYPPAGCRGVSRINPATNFGIDADAYLASANESLLTIIQIETREGLEQIEEIATIDGVDVLFVGPTDLSYSLGISGKLNDPDFSNALLKVVEAARRHGKSAGILVADETAIQEALELGFSFIAFGSDAGLLSSGMHRNLQILQQKMAPLERLTGNTLKKQLYRRKCHKVFN